MYEEETETIALAVNNFEKGVYRILERRDPNDKDKSRDRVQRLMDHTKHLLIELFNKRRSLRAFLRWFEKEWIRLEVDLERFPVQILKHSMQCYLRCQDSFILITSGECRHEYDMKVARTTKFRSRLSTLQERDDGYTVLYKDTGIYSGFGFDEFNNEIVGIRALLVKELKRYHNSPWDFLDRQGVTELLEIQLDKHEIEAKDLQNALQSLKLKMIENICKRLKPKNLKFATQDKMERLSLSIQGQKIDLERRAKSFQIEGPLLHTEKQRPEDWNSFALEFKKEKDCLPYSQQKRRRVIVDSDSEDDITDTGVIIKSSILEISGKSSGLLVKVDSSLTNTECEESLGKIKTQMGINTHELELARESLEGEGINKDRVLEEEQVLRFERILNRALTRDEVNPNEVWDARECLRRACMEAGNAYLWGSRHGCVERAIQNFRRCKSILADQRKSNSDQRKSNSLPIQINLLYLEGCAEVNIGIALVVTSERKITTPKVKIFQAVEEFKTVKGLMVKSRNFAEKSSLFSEAASYILKSKQLESLACRWGGMGYWLVSQEKKSIESFQQASQFLSDEDLQKWSDFEDEIFDLAAESIYATCELADRCYSKMEGLDQSSRARGDQLLGILTRALDRHTEICGTIERLYNTDRAKEFRLEYEITFVDDVILHRNKIIKWWEDSKNHTNEGANRCGLPSFKRSDVSSTVNVVLTNEPTNSIFSSDGKRKRCQKRKIQGASSRPIKNRDDVHALYNTPLIERLPSPPKKYRRWGDELLPVHTNYSGDKNKEAHSDNLQYPSVAPPIPLEYQ